VDIDMTALRGLESEKDISLDVAVKAIEDALLIAYHRTEGAAPRARVELDRQSGHVTVWATETDEEGTALREYDDTPTGFGRIAATTAKQVILQRLRDAEDELTFGEYAGREGDIVSGIIQQGKDPRNVLVDLGRLEAVLPPQEQVPGERYDHGERLRAYVVQVRKGHRGPSVQLSRTHPNLVRKLFALEVPEIADGTVEIAAIAREAGHRTKIAVRSRKPGVNAKGACIGPLGSRVRNVMAELHGEKIDIVDWSDDPAEFVGNALSPARVSAVEVVDLDGRGGTGDRPRLPALPGDRQGRAERPARGPADRLADRHPIRHRAGGRTVRADLLEGARGRRIRIFRIRRACDRSRRRLGAVDS
jgi:N utilization substance protein A